MHLIYLVITQQNGHGPTGLRPGSEYRTILTRAKRESRGLDFSSQWVYPQSFRTSVPKSFSLKCKKKMFIFPLLKAHI